MVSFSSVSFIIFSYLFIVSFCAFIKCSVAQNQPKIYGQMCVPGCKYCDRDCCKPNQIESIFSIKMTKAQKKTEAQIQRI